MKIQGSCYCGGVQFSAISHTPYPYLHCYCIVCRKTAGAGGFAINIMAQAETFEVTGENCLAFHRARIEDPKHPKNMIESPGKRYFCRQCGTPLWVADPRWTEWIYPFASAIDTPLPTPPEQVHIMLDFAVPWCQAVSNSTVQKFSRYPEESVADWHKRHGLYQD